MGYNPPHHPTERLHFTYNVVLVSVVQQRESAVRIAISPLFVAFSPVLATHRFSLWNPVGSLVIYLIHSTNSM